MMDSTQDSKQVGAQAGHVADVVSHVVGYYSRIPGIIFGNSALQLAHARSAATMAPSKDSTTRATESATREAPMA